jgi:hypothetical protein
MRHLVSTILVCLLCGIFYAPHAQAKTKDVYTSPNLLDLTKLSIHFNLFDMHDKDTFREYLQIADCKLYSSVQNSPFKQQELQQTVLKAIADQQSIDKPLFFQIPISLLVSDYNFDTQSLPIETNSQFKKVNILELIPARTALCPKTNTGSLEKITPYYVAKLDAPISLRRIPIQKNIAESVFSKLDVSAHDENSRVLYGYLLVKIDTVKPQLDTEATPQKITVHGQVNAIDLYIDQKRKYLFKRLDYSENF